MPNTRAKVRLPDVPHIPGRTPRPPEQLFAPAKAELSGDLSADALAASTAFRGALAALSQRYYWEAHELFEAVWLRLPPASAERHLLRGLIQIANAGLKARMGRANAVARILARARSSLAEAFFHGPDRLMGLTRSDLDAWLRQSEAESPD